MAVGVRASLSSSALISQSSSSSSSLSFFILGLDMLVVVLCIVIVVFVLLTIAIAMNGMTLVEVRWLSVLPLSLWFVAVDRCWKPGSSNVAMVGVLRLRIINFLLFFS